ncbi:hypothetical protein HYS47_01920 [Candidatus Woesearchaeota archaeon]|nr:hypothetical protein [Candidatus Woesearchaeota archaeon]
MKSMWLIAFLVSILSALIVATPFVSAATIQGSVYNINLDIVENAILDISTTPHQRFVAQDGTYRFEVPPGTYTITARMENNEADDPALLSRDTITVKQDGAYVFDIFLFPTLNEEEEFFEDLNLQVDEPILPSSSISIIISIALLIVFLLTLLIFLKIVWKKGVFRKEQEDSPQQEETPVQTNKEQQDQSSQASPTANGHQEHLSGNQPGIVLEQQPDELYGKKIIELLQKNQGRMTQKEIRKELPLSEAKVSLLITELEYAAKIKKIKKGRGNIIVLQ